MLFVKACTREQREQAVVLLLCKKKSQMCFYSQEEALASKTLNVWYKKLGVTLAWGDLWIIKGVII